LIRWIRRFRYLVRFADVRFADVCVFTVRFGIEGIARVIPRKGYFGRNA